MSNHERSPAVENLYRHCTTLPPGPVADELALRRLLADAWDDFASDDGGMEPYKLLRPLEAVSWSPPVLSFVIERHGGLAVGGTRAERQHWHVDVEAGTATLGRVGWRQNKPQSDDFPVKATAAEVIEAIRNGQNHDRLSILLNRKFTIQIPGIAHFSKQGSRIVHGGLLDGEVRQDHWNNFKG